MQGAMILAMMLAAAAGTPELPTRAERGSDSSRLAMPAVVRLGGKWGMVTSVHRTPERNRLVGGAPNSFHLAGRAIDIARRPGVTHAEIAAAYRRAGYVLLESLDEGDHSHFAFGLPGEAPRPAPAPRPVPQIVHATTSNCAVDDAIARRRPDRVFGCVLSSEPALRLRPLAAAP